QDVPELAGQLIIPTGRHPTTAVLTCVSYSAQPFVRMVGHDGDHEDWTLVRYLRDSQLGASPGENERLFGAISEFQVGVPVELCRQGVRIYDSPGTDDNDRRTEITMSAVRRADAVILVFNTNQLAPAAQRDFAASIEDAHTKLFTVVNVAGDEIDTRLLHETWERLIGHRTGETYAGQDRGDLEDVDVYFVDALAAARSRSIGDETAVEATGLPALERRLATYLVNERGDDHLLKFLNMSLRHTDALDQDIAGQLSAVTQEAGHLEARLQRLEGRLSELARWDEMSLQPRFEPYRETAQRAVQDSYALMIASLRDNLAAELMAVPIAGLPDEGRGRLADLGGKAIIDELSVNLKRIVDERFDAWRVTADQVVSQALEPLLEVLNEEVADF